MLSVCNKFWNTKMLNSKIFGTREEVYSYQHSLYVILIRGNLCSNRLRAYLWKFPTALTDSNNCYYIHTRTSIGDALNTNSIFISKIWGKSWFTDARLASMQQVHYSLQCAVVSIFRCGNQHLKIKSPKPPVCNFSEIT